MKNVRRFDIYQTGKAERTANGFLRVPIRATRVGIFEYVKEDGSIFRELRPPEEVFKDESLETLKAVPITNEHPEELLNPGNAKEHSVGYTADTIETTEDTFVEIMGTVTDAEAISDIEAGKQEVSCGYTAELDLTPGVWEGQEYDAVQRNIVYNHVAITDRGRAGREVRMKLDSEMNATFKDESSKGESMKKIKIGDAEFEVSDAMFKALNDASMIEDAEGEMPSLKSMDGMVKAEDAEAAKEEVKSMEKDMEEMEGKMDSLKSENRKLKREIETKKDSVSPEAIKAAVKERVTIEKTARKVLDAEAIEKIDELDNLELKKAVIKADDADANLDDKSEGYVDGRFDSIAGRVDAETEQDDELGKEIVKNRKDSVEDDAEQVRDEKIKRDSELWKKPLSATKESKK